MMGRLVLDRSDVPGSEKLTILAVADEVSPTLYDRFDLERWREVDLILSCGDLPPSYLDFLCSMLDVPVFYVRGNHDGKYQPEQYAGSENIHGRIVQYRGRRIAGFEGSHRYNRGPVQYTERQMRGIVRRARLKALYTGRPDIVLTHAPPFGCHDGQDPCHRGFRSFRRVIDAWHPRLFIHGHMHAYSPGMRESMIGSTRVVHVFPYTLLTLPARSEVALAPAG